MTKPLCLRVSQMLKAYRFISKNNEQLMQNNWSKHLLGSAENPWLSFVQYSILHSDKFTIIRALTLNTPARV